MTSKKRKKTKVVKKDCKTDEKKEEDKLEDLEFSSKNQEYAQDEDWRDVG